MNREWLAERETIRFFEFSLGGVPALPGGVSGRLGRFGGLAEMPPWAPRLTVVNSGFEVPEPLQILVVLTSGDVTSLSWSAGGRAQRAEPIPSLVGYSMVSAVAAGFPPPTLERTAFGDHGEVLGSRSWEGRNRI